MGSRPTIAVEVVYAKPERQAVRKVEVPVASSVLDCIRASGLLTLFPEIDLQNNPVGVFGRVVPMQFGVAAGDRVEIYRPLEVDPKVARRKRARIGGTRKRATDDER